MTDPTPKQIAYGQKLGIDTEGHTKESLSKLIDAKLNNIAKYNCIITIYIQIQLKILTMFKTFFKKYNIPRLYASVYVIFFYQRTDRCAYA